MEELGGGTTDDPEAALSDRNQSDASIPELLGRAIGRHLTFARITAGLALTIASLGMLVLFLGSVLDPYHYERSGPPIGEVCYTDGSTTVTLGCFEADQDALDQAFEDEMNHDSRVIGVLGAITSCTALVLAWRLWRSPWRQGKQAGRRARIVLAAACLSPVAAIPVFVTVGLLVWSYRSAFE